MADSRTVRGVLLTLLIATYLAVRLWGLTNACLWFDEIFSVHAAEHGWGEILNFVALDLIHPPLFYILLKLWIAAGGESLLWLRLFPVVWSVIAVYPFLRFCGELKIGKWTRLLALFLLAVNGSLIKYSQEVRMYAPLMCLSLFSMWLFTRYFVKGKSFVPLVIVNALMVYTHYFGWFVVVAEVGAILWFQRIKWRRIALMLGIVTAAFGPWLIAVINAARSGSDVGQNIGWMLRPGIREVGNFVLVLIEPFYFQVSSVEPESIYRVSVPLLAIALGAIVYGLAKWRAKSTSERTPVLLLLLFIGLPADVVFVASWLLPHSLWGTRHLIIVFAPFLILAAAFVTALSARSMRNVAIALILILAGYGFVGYARRTVPQPPWCGFEKAATDVLAADVNGPVYVFEDLAAYHLWFAFRGEADPKIRQRVVKLDGFPGMTEDKAYFLPRGMDDEFVKRETPNFAHEKMWIVYRADEMDPASPPLDSLISNGYHITRSQAFNDTGQKVISVLLEKAR